MMASALFVVTGCEAWRSAKVDHPVLGPPPPRVSWEEEPDRGTMTADASGESTAGYVKVSLSEPGPLTDHAVVAMVNGEPILAGEVLAPYAPYFAKMQAGHVSERQIEQAKRAIFQKDLSKHIEEALLVQALRLMVKPDQLKSVDEQLDAEFDKECQRIMELKAASSKIELEQKLAEEGTSLAEYRQAFKNRMLATTYMQTKASERIPVVGRQEILQYYTTNLAKYEHPARAQFQLLMTRFDVCGGREPARAKMDAALDQLARGDAFGDVVIRNSDHPSAKKGGQHDWYKPGEFNSPEVNQALFNLPVDEVSPVFEMPTGFVVVKVTAREPAGRTPLSAVQDEIRQTLLKQAQDAAVKDLLAELQARAVVTTYLD